MQYSHIFGSDVIAYSQHNGEYYVYTDSVIFSELFRNKVRNTAIGFYPLSANYKQWRVPAWVAAISAVLFTYDKVCCDSYIDTKLCIATLSDIIRYLRNKLELCEALGSVYRLGDFDTVLYFINEYF